MKNNPTPTTFNPITTPEIFSVKLSQLVTSMIGNTESTTNRSVTANPENAATTIANANADTSAAARDYFARVLPEVPEDLVTPGVALVGADRDADGDMAVPGDE